MKCEICKCLNMHKELKKHPSVPGFRALRVKLDSITGSEKAMHSIAGCPLHGIIHTVDSSAAEKEQRRGADIDSLARYVDSVEHGLDKLGVPRYQPYQRLSQ